MQRVGLLFIRLFHKGKNMEEKKIEIGKDINGIANVENGATIHQYINVLTSPTPIDNKKCKEINEYSFHKKIEKDKYICQKGNISIEANLPKVDFSMSFLIDCQVLFKLENNKTILIALDNEATLKELFDLYMYVFKEKNESDDKIITYTLGSITFEISMETFDTLIKIANDLQEEYTERINQLEEKLESKDFPLSKEYKNGFELCEVNQELWIKIPELIRKQKLIRKQTESKIFDRDELGTLMHSNTRYFIWGKNKIISASIEKNYDIEFKNPIRIMLVWNTLDFFPSDRETKIQTVAEVHKWLTEKLIPEVEKIENMDSQTTYIYSHKYESDEEYKNKEFKSINKIICSIYLFYKNIILNKNSLRNLYKGLLVLLENSKKLDINNLTRLFNRIGNINTRPLPKLKNIPKAERKNLNPTKEYFINRINVELEEINKGDMSMENLLGGKSMANRNFIVNEIFNCYSIILQENKEDDYSSIIIHEVYQKLKIFEKISTVYSTRDRMMMPFWD